MVLQPGEVLHSHYRIVKLLAQGGFGTLYRAWDTTLERPCAIKENLDSSPDIQRQFLREAKILARLAHPNLPRVTDYFIESQGQYLVMEFIEGQDLQGILDDHGGPLSEDQVLPWIVQVCDALSYLHTQNPPVIHRDVKPANIRITPQGRAMLVDFGIAKSYDPHVQTTVGAQAVTPGYSPYEQYGVGTSSDGITDARSDVYALGATLYTLLTGRQPPESVQRVVRDPLTPPRLLVPGLSARTAAAVMRALQLDPSQRFQSTVDLKAALSVQPRPPLPAPSSGQAAPPARKQTMAPGVLTRQPIPWRWIGLVGALSLVILALLIVIWNGRGGAIPPRDATTSAVASVFTPPVTASLASAVGTAGAVFVVTSVPTDSGLAYTLTVTLAPSLVPLVYTVQVGDTCSGIAQAYGVTIESIVSLNSLSPDCGLLYAGQELLIPVPADRPVASSTPARPIATQVSAADRMVLVNVPSGEFKMGSAEDDPDADAVEKPQHVVYLSVFWIDQTEVTNAMYARCVNDGVCKPPANYGSKTRSVYYGEARYQDYPVIYVSWGDASAYCRWAGRRLPSEAEWEKAARGTDGRIYPWGDAPPTPERANYGSQVGDTSRAGSYPSGASPYGVFDLAGNVAEWVSDWYGNDYYVISPYKNPFGPPEGEFRVLRGGSWFNKAWALRSAFRLWNYPDLRSETVGFRCAR